MSTWKRFFSFQFYLQQTYTRLITAAGLFLVSVTIYLRYIVSENSSAIIHAGMIASVATVIMFGSPLASLVILHFDKEIVESFFYFSSLQRAVIEKQSTESLSFPLCFANFIVPIEWVLYGILINDKFVQVISNFNRFRSMKNSFILGTKFSWSHFGFCSSFTIF